MTESYREVKLEGTDWMLSLALTEEFLNDVSARVVINRHLNQAVIHLRGRLFYENLETIEYPSDWWQAFKARWFPGWARRRWPVCYRRYEINAYYPSLALPAHKGHVWIPRLKDQWKST